MGNAFRRDLSHDNADRVVPESDELPSEAEGSSNSQVPFVDVPSTLPRNTGVPNTPQDRTGRPTILSTETFFAMQQGSAFDVSLKVVIVIVVIARSNDIVAITRCVGYRYAKPAFACKHCCLSMHGHVGCRLFLRNVWCGRYFTEEATHN